MDGLYFYNVVGQSGTLPMATQNNALLYFQAAVLNGDACDVWRVPRGGGEVFNVAHFPGLYPAPVSEVR